MEQKDFEFDKGKKITDNQLIKILELIEEKNIEQSEFTHSVGYFQDDNREVCTKKEITEKQANKIIEALENYDNEVYLFDEKYKNIKCSKCNKITKVKNKKNIESENSIIMELGHKCHHCNYEDIEFIELQFK